MDKGELKKIGTMDKIDELPWGVIEHPKVLLVITKCHRLFSGVVGCLQVTPVDPHIPSIHTYTYKK